MMKKTFVLFAVISLTVISCNNNQKVEENNTTKIEEEKEVVVYPEMIKIEGISLNPEGIEFNKKTESFFLSSLNALPIVEVQLDGSYKKFTSGEEFPLSTAGLHIDYKNNRLLVAGFNGLELMDGNPETKGVSFLRVYNLETGILEQEVLLSSLVPNADAYFANDLTVDSEGNVYVSDWYAKVIYKVNLKGEASVFWENKTGIPSGPNGIECHSDGYLIVSILNVDEKGLYSDYGLVKIPLENSNLAKLIDVSGEKFTGFDGMIIDVNGSIVGVTNDGENPGGNLLVELKGDDNWASAKVASSKNIVPSTTVAVTPENKYFIINQDFVDSQKDSWVIEQIKF